MPNIPAQACRTVETALTKVFARSEECKKPVLRKNKKDTMTCHISECGEGIAGKKQQARAFSRPRKESKLFLFRQILLLQNCRPQNLFDVFVIWVNEKKTLPDGDGLIEIALPVFLESLR